MRRTARLLLALFATRIMRREHEIRRDQALRDAREADQLAAYWRNQHAAENVKIDECVLRLAEIRRELRFPRPPGVTQYR